MSPPTTAWPRHVAAGSGLLAAALQFAGALKSLPGLAALPVDLTLLVALPLLPALALLLLARRWEMRPILAAPLLAASLLLLWLTLAGGWSSSRLVLAEKLPQLVLLGPAMLLAGLLVGADAASLRRFCSAVVVIGLLIGAATAWGVMNGTVILGGALGQDPQKLRVQYQLAGLAIACAAGLAALRVMEARGPGRVGWVAILLLLGLAVLVPGGRAALLGLLLGAAGAPALLLCLSGRWIVALGWLGLIAGLGLGGLAALLALPGVDLGLRTLERLFGDPATATPARLILWGEALRWAAEAAPWGLGTGGFTLAAGTGDDRSLHPHNHALEALVEGGLPGLLLWLLAFGGAVALAIGLAWRVAPGRAARVAALTLPVALTAMVSTDLGNRMVWFGLGLLLSLGMEARPIPPMATEGPHV
ncbi:O-antigen ligase family protein [Roseicella frigidaeris]|uniref:O-antigen ligase domain-containing protein n=1 Tax=Roseicella frigidaeris TaxID=2230885 RepID=A0A327MFY4_9PROT|nr:O-antigen ligase family protein [Roseicella frigidaeris]RAI60964.1 O-antigen ligase domain-containing protein [Roseicella frigidaeris]